MHWFELEELLLTHHGLDLTAGSCELLEAELAAIKGAEIPLGAVHWHDLQHVLRDGVTIACYD